MKRGGIPFVVYGGLFAFVASMLFVVLGGVSFFGPSPPDWVTTLFTPGIYVGYWTWEHVTNDLTVCTLAGVLTMTLLGALLGALVELFASRRGGGGE